MAIVKVKIEGITPLLMNRFNSDELDGPTGARPKKDKNVSTYDIAKKTAYLTEKGQLYVPADNLFASIIDAGKFEKVGKSKLTTLKSSLIPAGCSITERELLLKNKDFEIDSRSVVNPSTGGRIMKHRAMLSKWELDFTLEIDTHMFTTSLIKVIVEHAGSKCGLGDYRPNRKGSFGKFKIVKWKEK